MSIAHIQMAVVKEENFLNNWAAHLDDHWGPIIAPATMPTQRLLDLRAWEHDDMTTLAAALGAIGLPKAAIQSFGSVLYHVK